MVFLVKIERVRRSDYFCGAGHQTVISTVGRCTFAGQVKTRPTLLMIGRNLGCRPVHLASLIEIFNDIDGSLQIITCVTILRFRGTVRFCRGILVESCRSHAVILDKHLHSLRNSPQNQREPLSDFNLHAGHTPRESAQAVRVDRYNYPQTWALGLLLGSGGGATRFCAAARGKEG